MNFMIDELDFPVIAVEQNKLALGFRNRQRQPGKPGPGADIQHAASLEVRPHGETVEQMQRQHRFALAHGGQVHSAIPALQLVDERFELLELAAVQRLPECPDAVLEPLPLARGSHSPSSRCSRKNSTVACW